DQHGEFRIGSMPELEGAQALIEVVPPPEGGAGSAARGALAAASPRLSWGGPRPLRLPGAAFGILNPQTNAHELRLDAIALASTRTVTGQVHGTDARRLAGVRLWACRHDELASSLAPIPGAEATTDQNGRFEIGSLPAELGPQVSCIVLARLGDE